MLNMVEYSLKRNLPNSPDYKLKGLKVLYKLALMRGKGEKYEVLLEKYKEFKENYNEDDLLKITNSTYEELRQTEGLEVDITRTLESPEVN